MRKFPIMRSGWEARRSGDDGPLPEYVPWAMVEPHEGRARSNHGGQSLETLAQRGGLDPWELLAVLEDRPVSYTTNEKPLARLRALIVAHAVAAGVHVVGRVRGPDNAWELQAVCRTRDQAVAFCSTPLDFVARVPLDEFFGDDTAQFPEMFYPLAPTSEATPSPQEKP